MRNGLHHLRATDALIEEATPEGQATGFCRAMEQILVNLIHEALVGRESIGKEVLENVISNRCALGHPLLLVEPPVNPQVNPALAVLLGCLAKAIERAR